MSEKTAKYNPLSEEEVNNIWKKHKSTIEGFIISNNYDANRIFIDDKSIMYIIARVDQRRKYFVDYHNLEMSEYKEAALNSFWYIKLHPLNIAEREFVQNHPDMYDSINEKLALYIIIITLRSALKAKHLPVNKLDDLPLKYIDELIYSFTHRDISKEAMIMLVESMAVFLGLNPYTNDNENDFHTADENI